MKRIFITGIGTDVGKTVVSAIITEALKADYWKPIQAGFADGTDSLEVGKLVSNNRSVIHKESYKLKMPASPHAAAAAEDITIEIKNIQPPQTANTLVIEGAGGLLVPINNKELVVDLISALDASVIVVVRNYLGSINHSLLTLEALERRGIPVIGIVFNGPPTPASESVILSHYKYPVIGHVKEEKAFTKEVISRYANEFLASGVLDTFVKTK